MKTIIYTVLFCFTVMVSYGQNKVDKKAQKKAEATKEYTNTKALIQSGTYMFEAINATPMSGGLIDMVNNPNHIRVNEKNVDAFLPFYGERYVGGSYRNNGAIEFNQEVHDYNVSYNDEKQIITISFRAINESDTINFRLQVSHEGWATVYIRSVQRSQITYYGQLSELENDEK
ncbi:DUF4251 domain-containing protein [Mangrovimonas aestuarii]|uniref:DUF4251 domain-containing protein n=1 Tax=Mangrovimonas aestuarii TaxID=3018443 RepID=UPI002378B2A0|nr:DUF4251 domain-containing protein [Mangrovimonas aestuarii]